MTNKESQSLIDFLRTTPMSSFMISRSPLSNKEAQSLYDIWLQGEKDEYGKYVVPADVDAHSVVSLTTKGYLTHTPSRFGINNASVARMCEFTNKGKDVIQKIILHKEKSSFEKASKTLDYETILSKTASVKEIPQNWLQRSL